MVRHMCLRAARRWCSVDLVLGTMRLFESETAALREGVMTQLNMRANYEMGYTLDFLDDPLIPTAATRFDTALGKAGLIRRKYHILSTADIERVPLGEIYEVLNRVCTTQREVDNLSAVFIAKALHRISAAATLLSPRGFACLAALCFLNLAALVPSRQVTLAVKQAAYASYREMMMVAADRVTNDDTFLARLSVLSCARLLLGLQMSRIEADVVRAKLYGKIEEGVSIREYTIDTFMVCAYLHTVSGEVPKYVLQRMVEAFPIWDPDTFHASLPRILWYCMRCDLSLSDECLATFERMLLVNFHKTKGVTKFRNFFEKQRGWNGMLTSAMLHYRLSRRELVLKVAEASLDSEVLGRSQRFRELVVVFCALSTLRPDITHPNLLAIIVKSAYKLTLDAAVMMLSAIPTDADASHVTSIVDTYELRCNTVRAQVATPRKGLLCKGLQGLARLGGRAAYPSAITATEQCLVDSAEETGEQHIRQLAGAMKYMPMSPLISQMLQDIETDRLNADGMVALLDVYTMMEDVGADRAEGLLLKIISSSPSAQQALEGWILTLQLGVVCGHGMVERLAKLLRPSVSGLTSTTLVQIINCCARSAQPLPPIARKLVRQAASGVLEKRDKQTPQQLAAVRAGLQKMRLGEDLIATLDTTTL